MSKEDLLNLKIGNKNQRYDCVGSNNKIIGRKSLKNHTEQFIRQLLIITVDEMVKHSKKEPE